MRKFIFCVASIALLSGCENFDFATAGSLNVSANSELGNLQVERTIHATMSLYFLFEDPSNPFDERGEDFVPARVALPEHISHLRVVSDGSLWGWGSGSNESDARGDYEEATWPEYHSEISTSEELPVGSLVGMWSDGTRNNDNGLLKPFYIGDDAELEIPEGATELILGMHDGYEWSNNWGSRQVTIYGQ